MMDRMVALNNVYHAVMRWYSLTGSRIHELTDSERRILEYLRLEGLMFNA